MYIYRTSNLGTAERMTRLQAQRAIRLMPAYVHTELIGTGRYYVVSVPEYGAGAAEDRTEFAQLQAAGYTISNAAP